VDDEHIAAYNSMQRTALHAAAKSKSFHFIGMKGWSGKAR